MTPREKLELINQKIELLNSTILKNKKWKFSYINKGTNNYCIVVISRKKEIYSASFATFGSVLSALELFEFVCSKALKERDE